MTSLLSKKHVIRYKNVRHYFICECQRTSRIDIHQNALDNEEHIACFVITNQEYKFNKNFFKSRCSHTMRQTKGVNALRCFTKRQTDARLDVAFVCKSNGQIARTLHTAYRGHAVPCGCVSTSSQG